MEGKLLGTAIGLSIGLGFIGVYWVLGAILKFMLGIEIRRTFGYLICIIMGYGLKNFFLGIVQ